jgi:dihydrofolate reductase
MSELQLVAALDRCRGIGRDNALPWRLADDLKRFKSLTLGKPILMGRKTAQALGRALPGRRNLVLTRSQGLAFPGMEPVASLQQAIDLAEGAPLMVIGGGEVYALALPHATGMHLTHVDTVVHGADAFFPSIDPGQWQVLSREAHKHDGRNEHDFEYVDYRRVATPAA